jgi:hypothetical protein
MFKINEKESIAVMPVDEFFAILDNPRQRDTVRHAKKAQKAHLKEPAEIHKHVDVAVLPDGDMVKLDGHTRAYLWQLGRLESPPFVVVKLRAAKDMAEAMEMYLEYDNPEQGETVSDKAGSAAGAGGLPLDSALLRSAKYISALCLAKNGNIDSRATAGDGVYRLFAHFREELISLDSINPKGEKFVGGVMAAALITISRHGKRALGFWDLYNRDMGTKDGRDKDAVQMLTEMVYMRRIQKTLSSRHNVVDTCSKAIAACEKWLKGETYSGGIKGVDVMAYVKASKTRTFPAEFREAVNRFNERNSKNIKVESIAAFPSNPYALRK